MKNHADALNYKVSKVRVLDGQESDDNHLRNGDSKMEGQE